MLDVSFNRCLDIAMLRHLRHPPVGFEQVVIRHFKLKGKGIASLAATWIEEAERFGSRAVAKSMRDNMKAMREQFDAL